MAPVHGGLFIVLALNGVVAGSLFLALVALVIYYLAMQEEPEQRKSVKQAMIGVGVCFAVFGIVEIGMFAVYLHCRRWIPLFT